MRRGRLFRRRVGARFFALFMLRHLPRLVRLVTRLMRDPRVGKGTRTLFAIVLAYVIAPVDLIPDFFGFFGLVDDAYFLGLALHRLMAAAGPDVLLEHWDGDAGDLGFLVEGVEDVGELLPRRVRSLLQSAVRRSASPAGM
jgi:uncharacterized membrane protein YkvA (DUF1232 family)